MMCDPRMPDLVAMFATASARRRASWDLDLQIIEDVADRRLL